MLDRRHFLTMLAATCVPFPASARVAQGLFIHEAVKAIPALDIRDGEGRPFALASLHGRAVILNLWASWCLPCVAELPSLDRLKPLAEAEGAAVVALSLDRMGASAVRAAYGRIGITGLGIHVDETRAAAEALAVPVLPVTILIDRKGFEAARFIGPAQWDGPEALSLVRALASGQTITAKMAPPLAKHTGAAP